jgi:lipoprotein-releasing system ATP-binding protein
MSSVLATPVGAPGAAVPTAVQARGLRKEYVGGDGSAICVLDGVDLDILAGETVAVVGQSGSGKSTLLHVLGGLDRPSEGEVEVGGRRLSRMGDEELAKLRGATIGFVFQFHHLLREFSAVENVMMPQLIQGVARGPALDRARELLASVGLEGRLHHKPSQLSGGEQQRVAVARALANRPVVLLADEPSGNLDPQTSERLHDMLFDVSANQGAAMVLVTHDMGLAGRAGRVLRLHGGHLVPAVAPATEMVAAAEEASVADLAALPLSTGGASASSRSAASIGTSTDVERTGDAGRGSGDPE